MKVGDYVRTKYGIGKIIPDGKFVWIEENNRMYYVDKNGIPCEREFGYYVWSKDIIKSSEGTLKGLMELIEVGDYVNGMEVMEADWINDEGEYEERLAFPMYASDDLEVIENWLPVKYVKIKSIVTKEQFENMEYRIGDKNE